MGNWTVKGSVVISEQNKMGKKNKTKNKQSAHQGCIFPDRKYNNFCEMFLPFKITVFYLIIC